MSDFWFVCLCLALAANVGLGAEIVRLRKRAEDPWEAAWRSFAKRQGIRP